MLEAGGGIGRREGVGPDGREGDALRVLGGGRVRRGAAGEVVVCRDGESGWVASILSSSSSSFSFLVCIVISVKVKGVGIVFKVGVVIIVGDEVIEVKV
jgi:hypothetical protein